MRKFTLSAGPGPRPLIGKFDLIDAMAALTLLALPFLIYHQWVEHIPPTHRIILTRDACSALAAVGAPVTQNPIEEGCSATLPVELHNPLDKLPTIYFMKQGSWHPLMVSPNEIVSASPEEKI